MTHGPTQDMLSQTSAGSGAHSREVLIPPLGLQGTLRLPPNARALVLFAHGSGSSRFSPRNVRVAEALNTRGIGTLLFDLLTIDEEGRRENVFDIGLLAQRLRDAVLWARQDTEIRSLPLGVFGASTGAGAALVVAAALGNDVGAVVSRGGRPDLAGDALSKVRVPTLLIVGGADHGVIGLNKRALEQMACEKAIRIVPGATHLFPEAGALEQVVEAAAEWFLRMLVSEGRGKSTAPVQN